MIEDAQARANLARLSGPEDIGRYINPENPMEVRLGEVITDLSGGEWVDPDEHEELERRAGNADSLAEIIHEIDGILEEELSKKKKLRKIEKLVSRGMTVEL